MCVCGVCVCVCVCVCACVFVHAFEPELFVHTNATNSHSRSNRSLVLQVASIPGLELERLSYEA